ncbi:MAG: methylenetetrahydrofolate reductase [Candidatus Omnitrophica bacterium]|nr:methylenetetrahydrofolate reductase [Candidatus Omnitrophota bacterium]
MSLLKEKLDKGEFVVTSEIGPPKGVDIKECLAEAEHLKGRVAAINVTDNQSAVMRFGSLAACALLKEKDMEPVFQMVTRDRNRLALQSDLLSAYTLGVENVLCLTGDHPVLGDHPQAKPVYDLDSVQLLQAAKGLNEGKDMVGNPLESSPSFFLGAVVTPGAEPLEPQIIKMEKKVQAGARFFQTQAVYQADRFADFMDKVKHLKVPVLAGIVLLKSAGMAKFMNKNVAGVNVPEDLIDEMSSVSKEDRPKKSIEIAARLIKQLKPLCQGVHIMPLGWDKYVPQLLDELGL